MQKICVRGLQHGGEDTVEALFEAMRARHELCSWQFPFGMPESVAHLRRQLCDALLEIDDSIGSIFPLKWKESLQRWKCNARIVENVRGSHVRYTLPKSFEDFVQFLRQPGAFFPKEAIKVAAAINLKVGIIFIEPKDVEDFDIDESGNRVPLIHPDLWVTEHDCYQWHVKELNVPAIRVIMLARRDMGGLCLDVYDWAHQECQLCSQLSSRGSQMTVNLETLEPFPHWEDDSGL